MSAHTPGPWVAEMQYGENDTDCGWELQEQRAVDDFTYRGAVCRITDAEHIQGITKAERDANARLIAAAPDLLAAARAYMRVCPADEDTTHAFQEATDALRAAIAKAEGRS